MSKRCTAFTLIELLVVIAIISVLAAMLLPALSSARTAALSAGCVNIQKQLGLGFSMYEDEYGRLPDYGTTDKKSCWDVKIVTYLGGTVTNPNGIFHCPAGIIDTTNNSRVNSRGYAMNAEQSINPTHAMSGANVPYQNQHMVLLDGWVDNVNFLESFFGGNSGNREYINAGGTLSTNITRIANRHKNRINYLQRDGAVLSTTPGISGMGADIIWYTVTNNINYPKHNGKIYRDGILDFPK